MDDNKDCGKWQVKGSHTKATIGGTKMKKIITILIIAIVMSVATEVVAQSSQTYEWKNPPRCMATEAMIEARLKALIDNDYEAYVKDGTDVFKQNSDKSKFKKVSKALLERIKSGYKVEFLGALLTKDPEIIHEVWKISFANGEPDVLVRIWLKGGELNGFWWHW
jgi:formiminotetrahydrofolate cyclodeaminase